MIKAFNHWDRGDEQQRADFMSLLNKAGFDQPHIFCTDSSPQSEQGDSSSTQDEFAQLESTIESLADAQLVAQLEQRGVVKRVEELAKQASQMQQQLGTSEQLQFIDADNSLLSYLPWRKKDVAQDATPSQTLPTIADDLFFSHADGSVDSFVQSSTAVGLPFAALQKHLTPLKAQWRNTLPGIVNSALAQSLALPGERWQRMLYTLLGWLTTLLPLAALAWVTYRVVTIFQTSGTNPDSYLGSNFAVHGAMLIGVAWFIPWFLRLRTKPSRQAAALRGLRQGLQQSADKIDTDCQQALEGFANEREQLAIELKQLVSNQSDFDESALPASLKRMLMNSA